MGQPLPLPERIPVPKDTCKNKLEELGFTFNIQEGKDLCFYTMPDGYSFIDNSKRRDVPEWFFVDSEGMARAQVCGAWKETYDNDIKIAYIDSPYKFMPIATSQLKRQLQSRLKIHLKALEKPI